MQAAMKRLVVVSVLAAALVSCEKKKPEMPPVAVTVAPVAQQDVDVEFTWVGLLNGFQNADVRAQVTGYLMTQDYKEGSLVKKGDVLFTIDMRPFQAALAQAQADYAQKVAQAQLAQITLDRQTDLYKKKVISEQEYDVSAQDAAAAAAAAAAAQASVQAAQINLNYCTIRAPFDGIAGRAQAQIGDLVGPGGSATVLTQISQVDPIKAIFYITEEQYLKFSDLLSQLQYAEQTKLPNLVSLTFANGKQYERKGHFYFVNRQVDSSTGSIAVETLFENPDNVLRPGLFARVTAPVLNLKGALLVPQQALVELQGTMMLSVVKPDNTVATFPVKQGPNHGRMAVVESPNLKPGMNVVVGGAEKVRPGMTVTTSPYKAPETASDPAQAKGGGAKAAASPASTPAAAASGH